MSRSVENVKLIATNMFSTDQPFNVISGVVRKNLDGDGNT